MGFKTRANQARASQPVIFIRPDLQLSPLMMDDAEPLFALVEKNRTHLRRWMAWLDMHRTVEATRGFIQGGLDGYHAGTVVRWGIIVDGQLAGCIALEDIIALHKRAKIGYWLDEGAEGRGYVTESVRSIIDYAFGVRKLNLLELRAASENQKSRAIAGRVGMTYEGVYRQREWLYDQYVDLAIYTLIADEWILGADLNKC